MENPGREQEKRDKTNPETTKMFRNFICSQAEKGSYVMEVNLGDTAVPIEVARDVFPPQQDFIMGEYLRRENLDLRGAEVADIGTGSGIEAVAATRLGARHVDAVDINPSAVECSRRNFQRNDVSGKISIFESDLFSALPDKKYDVIFANLPFVDFEGGSEPIDAALYDNDFAVHKNFFEQAKTRLSDKGFILMPHANLQSGETGEPDGDFAVLEKMITDAGYKPHLAAERPFRDRYKWRLYSINK